MSCGCVPPVPVRAAVSRRAFPWGIALCRLRCDALHDSRACVANDRQRAACAGGVVRILRGLRCHLLGRGGVASALCGLLSAAGEVRVEIIIESRGVHSGVAAAPLLAAPTTAAAAANATFECYWADTAKSLNDVGLSNMMGSKSDDTEYVSGKEQRGATGPELLAGLEADAPGVSQQGCGFSL
mmetsp:Transcript_11607/g.18673  ORF Transcript_11607/g.18673 Transcript_11607/m.18673 type:complete len:184 (-) Transcript_11607:1052-1603(-)